MSKMDDFKDFVRNNPTLINHVKDGSNTWQSFYELYDLYGSDKNVWNSYLKKEDNNTKSNNFSLSNIIDTMSKIDTNKLEDGITSVQKALTLFGDIVSKNSNNNTSNYVPRPVYRRFDD